MQTVIFIGSDEMAGEIDRFRGVSMFTIKTTEITADMKKKYIGLEDVEVEKIFPNTIQIRAKGKKPISQVMQNDTYYLVDKNGVIFGSSYGEYSLPTISGQFAPIDIGYVFDTKLAHTLFPLLASLSNEGINITTVDVLDDEIVRMKEQSGVVINYSTNQDPSTAASSLQTMFRSFRIENRYPKRIDLQYDKPFLSY